MIICLHFFTHIQLDSAQKIKICCQMAKALAYMHGRDPQVIHQDIKPANVMVIMIFCTF